MNINKKLTCKDLNIGELRSLIEGAKAEATFWGGRKVTFKGHEGNVSVDYLVDTIERVFARYPDFDMADRRNGAVIYKKINAFYSVTDKKLQKSHFITRLFNKVREFSLYPYTPRWRWNNVISSLIFSWTMAQWQKAYPGIPMDKMGEINRSLCGSWANIFAAGQGSAITTRFQFYPDAFDKKSLPQR